MLLRKFLLVLLFISAVYGQQQQCEKTFADSLGGVFSDTGLFKTALDLSGYKDKLPPPSMGITILIGNNPAWLRSLFSNGFFFPSISKIGQQLPATMLYNVIPVPLSPDQIKSAAGEVPTVYGLLAGGSNYSLSYWADQQGTIRFLSPFHKDDSAKVVKQAIQVCNSWIYVVDTILYPAEGKIKNVKPVAIPDNLPWSNNGAASQPQPAAPAPTADAQVPQVLPVGPPLCQVAPVEDMNATTMSIKADAMPTATAVTTSAPTDDAACSTSFADAARANNLNILATMLATPSVQSLLPNPGTPNTLFAPSDAAFFTMMSKFNLNLATAASSLGDILGSILLYHIVPGNALTTQDIASRAGLQTDLANRLNDPSYTIGVIPDPAGGNPTVTGLYADNQAKIVKTVQLCETTVHLIDSVLVPASSLELIPKTPTAPVAPQPVVEPPTAAPSVTAPVTGPSSGTTGTASNIGGLANCLVKLELPGGVLTAITDANGQFAFPQLTGCKLQQAMAWLPAGAEQMESCIDAVTKQPPAFTLTSFLDVLTGDGVGGADSLLFTLSPLVSALTRELGVNDTSLVSAPWMQELTKAMGLSGPAAMLSGGYFDNAINGDADSLAVLAANAASLVTSSLGSTAISNLLPGVSTEDAASEILNQLGMNAKTNGVFTNGASITNLLTQALNAIQDKVATASGQTTTTTTTTQAGRKMMQAVTTTAAPLVPGNTQADVLSAVAESIAFMNGISLQSAQAARANPATLSGQATATINRIATVSESTVAPAVSQLSSGQMTADQYNAKFSPPNLTTLLYPPPTANAPKPAALAPKPAVVAAPPTVVASKPAVVVNATKPLTSAGFKSSAAGVFAAVTVLAALV